MNAPSRSEPKPNSCNSSTAYSAVKTDLLACFLPPSPRVWLASVCHPWALGFLPHVLGITLPRHGLTSCKHLLKGYLLGEASLTISVTWQLSFARNSPYPFYALLFSLLLITWWIRNCHIYRWVNDSCWIESVLTNDPWALERCLT